MSLERPLPSPDPLTAPYWEAAREERLVLPRCVDCGRHHFYPRSLCPHCGSAKITWVPASGHGEIYSFTIIHRAPSPAFAADIPYAVALVALEEGPHLMTNIIDCAPDVLRIGMTVSVAFRQVDEAVTLPVFKPV